MEGGGWTDGLFSSAWVGRRPVISPVPRHAGAGEMTVFLNIVFRVSRRGPRNRRSLGFARDDKGEGGDWMEGGGWTLAFFVALGGPQAHDFSGPTARRGRRDDKLV
jgi:hypothetical protein